MSYIKSYLVALVETSKFLGAIYLMSSFIGGNPNSFPFIYLVLFAAIGGPIAYAIGGKESVK